MRFGYNLIFILPPRPKKVKDYALWSEANQDGSWTQMAQQAVAATTLAGQNPKDIDKFCPKYSKLNKTFKNKFWVGLLSAMAKYESNFNPQTKYTEKFKDKTGKKVISRGLLQISIESANQKRYDCKIKAAKDLHGPATNLLCGAKILSSWVESDGVVAYHKAKNKGGARYWSVLRTSNPALKKISTMTRGLNFCGISG